MTNQKEVEESIIKNNRLIAEFMGGRFHALDDGFGKISEVMYFLPGNHPNPRCNAGTYKRVLELEYNIRYEWLMPVLEAIPKLNTSNGKLWFEFEISRSHCGIFSNTGIIFKNNAGTTIGAIYASIIQFINWYNQLNPTPINP